MKTAVVGLAFALGAGIPISAQQDDTVYRSGNGVSAPRLIKNVYPQVRWAWIKRDVNGAVLLRCVVDRDGVPTRLEIVQPLDQEIDMASLDALRQWRFEPGQRDGKAVLVEVSVTMAFTSKMKKSFWRRIWLG